MEQNTQIRHIQGASIICLLIADHLVFCHLHSCPLFSIISVLRSEPPHMQRKLDPDAETCLYKTKSVFEIAVVHSTLKSFQKHHVRWSFGDGILCPILHSEQQSQNQLVFVTICCECQQQSPFCHFLVLSKLNPGKLSRKTVSSFGSWKRN